MATAAATRADGLEVLSSMVTVGALVAFVFLHAATVRYFAGKGPAYVVVPVVGGLVILTVLVSASRLALVIAAGWFLLGLVLLRARPAAARALARGEPTGER